MCRQASSPPLESSLIHGFRQATQTTPSYCYLLGSAKIPNKTIPTPCTVGTAERLGSECLPAVLFYVQDKKPLVVPSRIASERGESEGLDYLRALLARD